MKRSDTTDDALAPTTMTLVVRNMLAGLLLRVSQMLTRIDSLELTRVNAINEDLRSLSLLVVDLKERESRLQSQIASVRRRMGKRGCRRG
jgi:hypothetical protein